MERPFVSSVREGRLWLLVVAVVALIWASVAVAGRLVEALDAGGLLPVAFAAGFVLVLAAIALDTLARSPGWRQIGLLVGIAVVFAMVVVRMGIPAAERTHLFEYGLLAVLVFRALSERRANGRKVPAPAVLAVGGTALAGWIDEGLQALVPGRVYDLRDVGFNALAGAMTVGASLLLQKVGSRRRASRG